MDKAEKTLVFSIAINGYQHLYRKNIDTHKTYCERHGYSYQCITKPGISAMGMECAWLKIMMIIRALNAGYAWVVFLDADTEVSSKAPAVQSLFIPGKSIYCAKGYSGRLNSGVMVIKNSRAAKIFFKRCLMLCEKPVPAEADVGWGENGHIIHLAKGKSFIQYIDQRWNNNTRPELDDYIRHYSAGPLRHLYQPPRKDKALYYLFRYCVAALRHSRRLLGLKDHALSKALNILHQQVMAQSKQVKHAFH